MNLNKGGGNYVMEVLKKNLRRKSTYNIQFQHFFIDKPLKFYLYNVDIIVGKYICWLAALLIVHCQCY